MLPMLKAFTSDNADADVSGIIDQTTRTASAVDYLDLTNGMVPLMTLFA